MNKSAMANTCSLNNSISKQLYSFSKGQRFMKSTESPCKKRFYDFKRETFSPRATSFGYGNKIDLANKNLVPPPGTYESRGEFMRNQIKRRGYSFSRESNRSIVNEEQVIKIPGPGKYDLDKDIKFSNVKYSFRSKFQSIFDKGQNDIGPGQYNTIELINKDGRHNVSKYQDSRSRSFTRRERFDEQRVNTPGPGSYRDHEKLEMNKTGTYFNSRFKSNASNIFGRSNRPALGPKTLSPGPGGYKMYSEFGNTYQ